MVDSLPTDDAGRSNPKTTNVKGTGGKGAGAKGTGEKVPGDSNAGLSAPAFSRRMALASVAAVAGGAAVQSVRGFATEPQADQDAVSASNGRLNQSLCRWCFSKIPLDDLARQAAALGLVGIDLLGPADFEVVKAHGLVCTMVTSHPLTDGLCDPKYHDMALEKLTSAIEATAAEGWRNVITFSGNARGIDRRAGMENCFQALKQILPLAESKGVVLNMELLNSKVDHPDYMCDNSAWGVELCRRVDSDHFKLLYDIYHMQIMEGDIIRTIQRDHQFFGHYHTAGNPGRHELNDQQELFYPPIARAIADTGFDGYFAHEFIPLGEPMAGLRDAVRQCTV
jgi:hydroxypyruvate isomerase